MGFSIALRQPIFRYLGEDISATVYAAVRRLDRYRTYRRTIRELAQLTAHDLADLGLHRSEIRRVAYESVYGQRA